MVTPAEGPRSVLEADNILHMATPAEGPRSVLKADNILHMAPPEEGPRIVLQADNILHVAPSAEGPGSVLEAGFNLPRVLPSKGSPRLVVEATIHTQATESLIYLNSQKLILQLQRDDQGSIFGLSPRGTPRWATAMRLKGQYRMIAKWDCIS